MKYLKAPITYDNMTRVETYPFPKDAVREALYNTLIHSCWSSGVPVQIRIEDDAMYISNDCVFPSDWTAETLMKRHRSRPYNPCIANAFFRAGYVESWGRGIQKICENCEAYGTALPEYIVHSEDIMVKLSALPIAQSREFKAPKVQEEPIKEPLKEPLEKRICVLMTKTPQVTYEGLCKELGVSRSTVKRVIKYMTEKGVIERRGGKRFGYWEVYDKL